MMTMMIIISDHPYMAFSPGVRSASDNYEIRHTYHGDDNYDDDDDEQNSDVVFELEVT